MQTRDLLGMCGQNLRRRPGRTMLTVLGVVIGACAIIIMVSIGIGMKESQEKMLSQMGDLTIIQVNPAPKGNKEAAKLDANALANFRAMPSVEVATPKLSSEDISFRVVAGRDKRYVSEYATVVGMQGEALAPLGYRIEKGSGLSQKPGSALLGANFAFSFQDTKRPEGHNMVDTSALYGDPVPGMQLPKPYFDPLHTPLELQVQVSQGEQNKVLSFPLKPEGSMVADYAKGYETADGLLLRYEELARIITAAKRAMGSGRPQEAGYQQVIVKTKKIDQVAQVEEQIKSMGFVTNSMESVRKPMVEEAQNKQMMLGGLGAISLAVAALGITNTMIMSISERTREIGIMKALGCRLKDIRLLFLLEAGSIGLLGGLLATLISLLISAVLNIIQSKQGIESIPQLLQLLQSKGDRMSVIPLWLVAFSLLFSVMIGVLSGLHPANKAVKIEALEAIKT